jgi:hypothetical protein
MMTIINPLTNKKKNDYEISWKFIDQEEGKGKKKSKQTPFIESRVATCGRDTDTTLLRMVIGVWWWLYSPRVWISCGADGLSGGNDTVRLFLHCFIVTSRGHTWTPCHLGFHYTTAFRTALGPTQPPIQWLPGALSLGVKRPGREADYSPPSNAEVKECVELYLHSPIRLHGVVLSYSTGTTLPFTVSFTWNFHATSYEHLYK